MAKQVIYARVSGKEITFGSFDDTVNLTKSLDDICHELFETRELIEEGEEEELKYMVIPYTKISDLLLRIEDSEVKLIEELKKVRGDEKKTELLLQAKDYGLLKALIIKMFLQEGDNSIKMLALI